MWRRANKRFARCHIVQREHAFLHAVRPPCPLQVVELILIPLMPHLNFFPC